mgnify:CR=1 FL=1
MRILSHRTSIIHYPGKCLQDSLGKSKHIFRPLKLALRHSRYIDYCLDHYTQHIDYHKADKYEEYLRYCNNLVDMIANKFGFDSLCR